jgi:tetratricopeptide (TPR) repeat protein
MPLITEQAQSADKEARRAIKNGELMRAKIYFARALQLRQSIDNQAEAAATLISLASVTHQMHDDEGALIWLDKILSQNSPVYPAQHVTTAAFHKAVILTNLSRLNEADFALKLSERLCNNICSLHFGIDTLRARLWLLNENPQLAMQLAQTVIKDNATEKVEQANALRVIAAAEEKLSNFAGAFQHYQQTLEMDKALGLSGRISEDLTGLARVSTQRGQHQEAALFAKRALLATQQHTENDSLPQNK